MVVVDIVFAALAALSVFIGLKKGLIKQVGNIAAVVLAFVFALKFYVPFSFTIQEYFPIDGLGLNILSFLIMFILFGLFFFVGVLIMTKAVSNSPLVILDKIGGVIFALAIILFIAFVLLYGISLFPLSDGFREGLQNTISYKIIEFIITNPTVKDVYPG